MGFIIVKQAYLVDKNFSILSKESKKKPVSICIYGKYEGEFRIGDVLADESCSHNTFEVIEFPLIRREPRVEGNIDILIRPLKNKMQNDWFELPECIIGKKFIQVNLRRKVWRL